MCISLTLLPKFRLPVRCRHVCAPGGFAADKAGEVEYAGKELALFLAELAKGNPKNVEPLFTRAPRRSVHESAVWPALRSRRARFPAGPPATPDPRRG